MKNTKDDFINVLVDCNGYSEEEAMEMQKDYRNDLEAFILGCGGGSCEVEECKEFLSII